MSQAPAHCRINLRGRNLASQPLADLDYNLLAFRLRSAREHDISEYIRSCAHMGYDTANAARPYNEDFVMRIVN